MLVEFLQAAKFSGPQPGAAPIFYTCGVHDVPEHVVNSPYFKLLLDSKLVIEPDPRKIEKPFSIEERNKMLSAKALAKPQAPEPQEEMKSEDKAEPEKKNKKNKSKE